MLASGHWHSLLPGYPQFHVVTNILASAAYRLFTPGVLPLDLEEAGCSWGARCHLEKCDTGALRPGRPGVTSCWAP